MSFDWIDYFKLANNLLADFDSTLEEAYYRRAISRYYYSAFHITENKMKTKYKYTPQTANAHQKLIEFLRNKKTNNHKIEKIWDNLRSLNNQRNSSDYDDEYDFEGQDLKTSAQYAKRYCTEIIKTVSELKPKRTP